MDIQKIITEVVSKLTNDKTLKENFLKDPVKVVEKLTGIDLPDDQINAIIEGVKAKINFDDVAGKAKGIMGVLNGLFGKK